MAAKLVTLPLRLSLRSAAVRQTPAARPGSIPAGLPWLAVCEVGHVSRLLRSCACPHDASAARSLQGTLVDVACPTRRRDRYGEGTAAARSFVLGEPRHSRG
jgi:hypothetical protein